MFLHTIISFNVIYLLITVSIPRSLVDASINNNENDLYAQPPVTRTQYKILSVQKGSAIVPHRGAPQRIGPDHNLTKTYLAKIDTTVITPKKSERKLLKSAQEVGQNRRSCVKCPPEKTVIARRGLDGVLIEPPPAVTCISNRPFSTSLYQVETLFGPQFMFILPQGTHSFIAKIRNKQTGEEEHTCLLKYKVIVRQCIRYRPRDRNLKVKCSLGNIWGSKCSFSCKNGGMLSHTDPVACDDDLEWFGDEPTCSNIEYEDDLNDSPKSSQCKLPVPPENGKFSCEINSTEVNEDEYSTPAGSICRIHCKRHHIIPAHLKQYAVFKCENGLWNSTMFEFCHRRHQNHIFNRKIN